MTIDRLLSAALLAALLVACSSSNESPPDAAAATPDAPTGVPIVGLGQRCGANMPACPAMTFCPTELPAAHAYCTALCFTGYFGTSADASPITFPDPSPGDSVCAAIYSAGAPGTPECYRDYRFTPPAPLEPETQYKAEYICTIGCDATRRCPQGLHCSADSECVP